MVQNSVMGPPLYPSLLKIRLLSVVGCEPVVCAVTHCILATRPNPWGRAKFIFDSGTVLKMAMLSHEYIYFYQFGRSHVNNCEQGYKVLENNNKKSTLFKTSQPHHIKYKKGSTKGEASQSRKKKARSFCH